MFVGRNWLGYTDAETLSLTPKQYFWQVQAYNKAMELKWGSSNTASTPSSSKVSDGFIDQIPGW